MGGSRTYAPWRTLTYATWRGSLAGPPGATCTICPTASTPAGSSRCARRSRWALRPPSSRTSPTGSTPGGFCWTRPTSAPPACARRTGAAGSPSSRPEGPTSPPSPAHAPWPPPPTSPRTSGRLSPRSTPPAHPARWLPPPGVRVEGLLRPDDGVQLLLDEDPRRGASERAADAVRRRWGAHAVAPASLLSGDGATGAPPGQEGRGGRGRRP